MTSKTHSIPLQTAFIYVIIAGSWIFFSDRFLAMFSTDFKTLNVLQTYKGFLFVSLTAILLFFSLRTKLRMVERERTQRTLTENKLYENEAQYTLIFENSGEAILFTEPNGSIFSANPAACKMFGRTREEICAIGRSGIVDVSDPRLQQMLEERKRTGILKGETNFIRNDGTIFTGEVSSKIFKDAQGNERTSMIIRDITERKRSEEALMSSESNLRSIINRDESIWSIDDNYNLIICNEYFKDSYRAAYNIEMNVGTNLVDILSPELKSYWKPKYDTALSGQRISFEFHETIQGNIFYFEVILNPIVSNEKVTGVTALSVNITVRKNAENELSIQAKQLSALLKSSQNLSTILNMESVFQTTTDSIIELTDLQSAAIYMLEGEILYLEATSPALPAQFPEELRRAPLKDHPHIYKAITTSQPVFLPDTSVADLTPAERITSEQRGLSSILYLPIIVKEKVIGVLIVAKIGVPRKLTLSEIDMCRTLSNLASIAVENSRLFESAQQEITDRKRMEVALLESEKRTRALIKQAPIGIAISNKGITVDANPAYLKMFGYPNIGELQGTSLLNQIAPECRDEITDRIKRRSAGENVVSMYESVGLRKDGTQFPFFVSATQMVFSDGIVTVSFFIDITESKIMEDVLRENEEKYRGLVENSPDAIALYVDGKIVFVNNQCAILMAVENKEELIGKSVIQFVHPDNRSRVIERMKQVAVDGKPLPTEEEKFIRFDGTSIDVEVKAIPTTYEQKPAVQIIVHDITERKQAEETLRQSEEKYRLLFNANNDGISIFYINNDETISPIAIANNSAAEMLGYDLNEFIGKHPSEFEIHETEEILINRMMELKTNGTTRFETELIHKNGEHIPVEINVQVIEYHNKPALMNIVRNISERKRAEESLRLSEQTYRGIIDSITEAIYIEDPNGIFLDVNRAAEKMYGYSKEEFIGRTPEFLSAPGKNDLSRLAPMLEKALNGEPQAFEFWGLRKDGTIFPKDVSNSLGYYFGKKVNIAVARDITERKQSEEALRQAQKMESIGTLAGGIAHDFNNLLNAVLGQSALAINKLPKESPAVSNITKAIQASERAADLTRQLLAYSGKGKFFTVEIDLNSLVKENVQMLEVSIPKTTQLRYELCSPSPRMVGDIGQIQQVIMNLIINAGEAMGPNPGYITVRTNRIELPENNSEYSKYTNTPLAAGSYAMLQVKDTGSGISSETLTRIFDPFFTTKFTGRGLGLAAVLGIIKGHKGGLRIESEEGKGTMFEIVWPFVESSKMTSIPEKKKPSALGGEGKTILIIDDDPFVFQLLEDVLSEVNFTVIGASDPLKGIDLYQKDYKNISMVILDFSMPKMNGKDTFDKLLQINDKVKVLLCSGYPEEDTLSNFGAVRPTGFFQKPYKTEALVEWVSLNS